MSQDHNHLNHTTWECKYHVVFTLKYRKKLLFGQIRRHLGTVFHGLARVVSSGITKSCGGNETTCLNTSRRHFTGPGACLQAGIITTIPRIDSGPAPRGIPE